MSKLIEIIIGWKNFISKDPFIEKIAEKRMEICMKCPELDKEKYKCLKCGCYMVVKTRSPKSKCPLDKWED